MAYLHLVSFYTWYSTKSQAINTVQLEKRGTSCNVNVIVMHFQMLHIFSMFLRHPFLIYASQIENKCMEHRFWYKTLARSISLYFITTMRGHSLWPQKLFCRIIYEHDLLLFDVNEEEGEEFIPAGFLTSAFDAFACEYVWIEDLIYDILGIILL